VVAGEAMAASINVSHNSISQENVETEHSRAKHCFLQYCSSMMFRRQEYGCCKVRKRQSPIDFIHLRKTFN
jgi:hypothetical protein